VKLTSSIGTLLAGTGFAQVLTIATLPVLTRLYSPESFGVLAFFGAGAMLAGLVVTGRYELAIPIVPEDEEARGLLRLATRIGLVASVVLGVVAVAAFRDAPSETVRSLPWVAASLVLTSSYQPLSFWFTRRSRFRAVSVTRVLQSGGTALAQIAAGAMGFVSGQTLVLGAIVGQLLATFGLEISARRETPLRDRILGRAGESAATLAHRHRGFPQFTALAGFLQMGAEQAPLLVIPLVFGAALAGTYALPARLLAAAVSLLAGSAAQAFYPEAARRYRDGTLASACHELQRTLLRWATVPIVVGAVVAPEAAALAFGPEWSDSGRWFRRLVPWFLASLAFGPLAQVWLVMNRQREALWLHTLVVITGLAALAIGAARSSPEEAILLFSISGAIVRIAGIEWTMRAAGGAPGAAVGALAVELARAAPFALGAFAAARAWPGSSLPLIVATGLVLAHVAWIARDARRESA
jgi:O-antigen/teichoic acid export membrane protein